MGARFVVGTVVAVGLLVGGAAVADVVVRDRTEERLAEELRAEIVGLEELPEVAIGGFPFLTQVLAGELREVTATAGSLRAEGLVLEEVVVELAGVSTGEPVTAERVWVTAHVPLSGLREILDASMDLDIADGALRASTTVLGLPLEARLVPRAAGGAIEVQIEEFTLAGASVQVEDLPAGLGDQIDALTFPVSGLPPGLELTEVGVEGQGIRITAEGADVVFDAESVPGT